MAQKDILKDKIINLVRGDFQKFKLNDNLFASCFGDEFEKSLDEIIDKYKEANDGAK